MRRSEIHSLRWPFINFDKRQIKLPDSKNGKDKLIKGRVIPLSTTAMEVLQKIKSHQDTDKVFKISLNYITTAFGRIRIKAGIIDLRFHDLRHEATSRLFEKGLSTEQVMNMTGHKTYEMLLRYTHLRPSNILELLG